MFLRRKQGSQVASGPHVAGVVVTALLILRAAVRKPRKNIAFRKILVLRLSCKSQSKKAGTRAVVISITQASTIDGVNRVRCTWVLQTHHRLYAETLRVLTLTCSVR